MDATARETLARARAITAEVATRCGLPASEMAEVMPCGPYAGERVPLIDWDVDRIALIVLDHPDGWDDPAASVPVNHWAIMGNAEPVSIPGLSIDAPIRQVLAWLTPWLPIEHRPALD